MADSSYVTVEVSPGELIDKITILQIKQERIEDSDKRANVKKELDLLVQTRERAIAATIGVDEELAALTDALKTVNEALWEIEDAIRECERRSEFGDRFIELARSVYKSNDRRAALKYDINRLLNSPLFEEKSYAAY